ncbi:hypothetical protein RSP795_10265 [Ralstonia solanacearum]|uniref:deoxynucleotide monophosphate kinase family protein n=1 Tax=Ralstonia solanacearum TaxID=305 RepID=UPI0007D866BD|nr:hypothetical protein [Ralstonia solanacearum]OAI62814.1 hypothetical protein RSP795_10265 [Ralstonia solanacearum]
MTKRSKPLVGFAGLSRVGKDTAARVLIQHLGYVRESFAAPIRQFVAHILGWSLAELEARKEEHIDWLGTTPRRMMQTVGTEWGRIGVNDRIWVNRVMRAAKDNRIFRNAPTVITDVRFDNEAETIRAAGGVVIHIVRPDALKTSAHVSEAGVTRHPGDDVLLNDCPQAEYEERVLALVSSLCA